MTLSSLQLKTVDIASCDVTPQEETVDEGLHLGELTLGQLTVTVTTDDAPIHAVADAKALPHLLGGLGRNEHRGVGQPLVVGIAEQQEGARTDQCAELVLVVRQLIDTVTVEVLLLALLEPVVVGLVEVFEILAFQRQLMRLTPSGSTAATRLLSNGQADALVEGAAVEGHLAGV